MRGVNLDQCSNIYRGSEIDLTSDVLCAGSEEGSADSCGDAGDLIDVQFGIYRSSNIPILIFPRTRRSIGG